MPVLAALAIAAVIAGGVAGLILLPGSGGNQRAHRSTPSTHATASSRAHARKQEQQHQQPAAPARTQKPPAEAAQGFSPASTTDPAALNDRGFQLIRQGDYAGAVQPLRASVAAYRAANRTGDLGYYFALFNLGVALNRSGDPGSAVAVLRERLRNPNQRGTVQRELDAAAAKLGGSSRGATRSGKTTDKPGSPSTGTQGGTSSSTQGGTSTGTRRGSSDSTAGYAPAP
jgi:hypothetical protein